MFNRQASDTATSKPIRWIDKITSFLFPERSYSFFNTTYLSQFFNEKDAASFSYLLKKTSLSINQIKRLASSAMLEGKPKIFNILATGYPDVITDQFIQDGLEKCSVSKEFTYALATFRNNGTLAPSLQRYFTDEAAANEEEQPPCCDVSNIGIFTSNELDKNKMRVFVRNNQRCGNNSCHFFFHAGYQYDPLVLTHAVLNISGNRAKLFCPNSNEKPVGEAVESLHQLFPDLEIDAAESSPPKASAKKL
jgi:hypothetical protein